MPIKSRLFASVAAPVLSLPLIIQPVYAGPVRGDAMAVPMTASNLVQVQEQPAEEGEEIIKRRQSRENAEEPQAERPQRAQESEGESGERPQRRERQAEEQQQERPRREQRAEEPQTERPARQERQADQGEDGERPRQRERQAQEQEQPQERPRREQRRDNAEQAPEQQQAAPERQAEEPKPREEPAKRAAETPAAERPPQVEQKAEEPSREKPRREQQNAEQPSEAKPAEQAKEPAARPETAKPTEPAQTQEPTQANEPTQRNAEQPAGEPPRQREQQTGETSPSQQGQDGQQQPEQRATSGGERPARPPVEQSAEQPMLPVENGAAVLDSAKEQRPDRPRRDGERPRRDPTRQQAGQQPQEQSAPPPRNDAEAQANERVTNEQREKWRRDRRELVEERGERMDERPEFERPRGWDILGPVTGRDRDRGRDRDGARDRDRDGGRVIISIDNQNYVRHNDSRRFYEDGRRPEYERLGDGRYREIVERSDGTRVVTIRNRYGEVVQRSRIVRGGEEYVLYYAPELLEDRGDYTWRDPGDDLPPMRLTVPIDDYIIDTSSEPDRDYYEFLEQPPVERVERPYSLDEVRYSARIRDKVPRIDLDTVTFATGSAEIPMNQARSLRKVADAINQVLEKDPSETFLIEGHTDAVGSDDSNLILSDERAESVAVVLSDAFGIPPENLTTQGYGEQYLKVNTEAANQENRRVTIRRITPLVKPVASNQ